MKKKENINTSIDSKYIKSNIFSYGKFNAHIVSLVTSSKHFGRGGNNTNNTETLSDDKKQNEILLNSFYKERQCGLDTKN